MKNLLGFFVRENGYRKTEASQQYSASRPAGLYTELSMLLLSKAYYANVPARLRLAASTFVEEN